MSLLWECGMFLSLPAFLVVITETDQEMEQEFLYITGLSYWSLTFISV